MVSSIPNARIQAITFPPPPSSPETPSGPSLEIARMNLNEAPGTPSPLAIRAITASLTDINRYPDHDCTVLAGIISGRTGIPIDRLSFGSGSGEILVALAMMAINEGDDAIMPSPTFPTCPKGVQIAGGNIINVPLRSDGSNDVDAMLDAITDRTRLFYLCTPNNPTGGIISQKALVKAASQVPETCLLVVDEAYFEFAQVEGGPDVLSLLAARQGPWVVTRSFSKAYCLAGLRVGYSMSSDAAVNAGLWQLRPNFNIGRVSLAAASAAIQDDEHLNETLRNTIAQRQQLAASLARLDFQDYPSFANFLTVRCPGNAQTLQRALAQRNIQVQSLPWPDAAGSLRITIDTPGNNARLITALEEILDVV